MTLSPAARRGAQRGERRGDRGRVAAVAPGAQAVDLLGLGGGVDDEDAAVAGGQRRGLGLGVAVDADHQVSPASMRARRAVLESTSSPFM